MTPTSNTIEILTAAPRKVKLADKEILVHEVSWLDLMRFAEALSTRAAGLLKFDEAGGLKMDIETLPALIASSRELSEQLLGIATNLDGEAIAQMPASAALRVIDIALEVNLTPEFLDAGKAVAARVVAAMARRPGPSAASSSS
jgi:hypothetical protein